MLKRSMAFLLSVFLMLSLQMRVFADAALPPGYIDQKDSGSPMVVVLIAAVVVIAAVIIIRALSKRKKK